MTVPRHLCWTATAADDDIDALSLTAQDRQIIKGVAVDEQEVRERARLEYT